MQENWARLKPLFDQALSLSTDERVALIGRISAEDRILGAQLAALIAAHERTESVYRVFPRINPRRPDSDRCFAEGETLLDRFRIVRFIAHGGMGEVYEAWDNVLGRVALKTVRADAAGGARTLTRFHREINLSRRVTDNGVCRVHDLFTVPSRGGSASVDFLTMEYIDGPTLAGRIKDGPLPPDEAREIAVQLCSGVGAIHEAGIIHRDLKSSNIMLARSSRDHQPDIAVKIMDLGLACETEPEGSIERTGPNAVMGTLPYMAPEQFEGSAAGRPTDIYALGVVLYEMITGERPFPSKTAVSAAIERAKKVPPPSSLRPEIPWRWDAVILRCLEVDPSRRFASAAEVAAELTGPTSAAPAPARRRRFGFATAVVVLALVAAVALAWNYRLYPRPSPEAEIWYERGLEALREGTYHKASQELTRATALDPNFLLAHARLADAWAELDYIGKAKDEILKASGLESRWRVSSLDANYVDAVRSSVTLEFTNSLSDYRAILDRLPRADKPYGYVDVGRAYEKAADISNAIANYREAARLAPEYPASFVRLGILEARQSHQAGADAAFTHAKDLYAAASDTEGVAEVAYQRAYAVSLIGDYKQADKLLDDVLNTARAIHSPQLEVRALLRLSTNAYNSERSQESATFAERAIDLAREKSLEYWEIDGLVRLGNAWLDEDLKKAESPLLEALQLARDSQRPRLEASAGLSLAIIRDQQVRPDECLALAGPALDYFSRAGFSVDAMTASLLMARAERDKGEFKAALPHAMHGLDMAKKLVNTPYTRLFEELTGSVLLDLERFAEALPHLSTALHIAQNRKESVVNEKLFNAEALFRLGRYDESKTMLDSIPADAAARPRIAASIDRVQAWMSATRLDFPRAAENARRGLALDSGVSKDLRGEFELLAAESVLAKGKAITGASGCRNAAAAASESKDAELYARANLCLAEAGLAEHSPQTAVERAGAAADSFAASGQLESESFALLALAKAYRDSGNNLRAREFSFKALDTLNASQHNQGNPAGDMYARRPDITAARAELVRLSRE